MRKKLILNLRKFSFSVKKNQIILNHPNSFFLKKDFNNIFFLSASGKTSKSLIKEFNFNNRIYEKILTYLTKFLNEFHNVNYPKLYWRILIGVWLYKFISIVLDKLDALKKVTKKYKKIDIENLKYNQDNFIPYGTEDLHYFAETDDWNNYIFREIIKDFKLDSIKKINKEKKLILTKSREIYKRLTVRNNNYIKKILYNFLSSFQKPNSNLEYFIFDTYLHNIDEVKINFALNKKLSLFKSPKSKDLFPILISTNEMISKKRNIGKKISKNNFENILYDLCKRNIPKCFMEYFRLTNKILEKNNFPKKPRVIFSTRGVGGRSTLMDMYVANKVINGSKLVIAQHGGNYGQHKMHMATIHEKKTSQRFLSWGFKNGKKVKPLGIIKRNMFVHKYNNKNKLILFETRPRNFYSQVLRIDSGAANSSLYMEKLYEFFSNLKDKEILHDLKVKMHSVDYGLNDRMFLLKANKQIKFLETRDNMKLFYRKAKLVVHTFHGTGHLEAMAANIPNLLYFLNDVDLLKTETKKYFIEFKRLGIIHNNPISLIKHLKLISKNPGKWWFTKEIQLIRKKYVNDFAIINKNLNIDIVKNLKEV
jgi:putative transferase (TIGR04331 family)